MPFLLSSIPAPSSYLHQEILTKAGVRTTRGKASFRVLDVIVPDLNHPVKSAVE